jgi:hypothetical protein
MANRNWASGGKIYSMHVSPVLLDCNFVVAPADTAGLGITSLKGPAIHAVYMNSSAATPSALNPNPAAGTILVQATDNFNRVYSIKSASIQSPLSGSPLTSVTAGISYVITAVGTTTAAQFQAKGLPRGVTPAIGVAFVATATGALGGTGAVQIAAAAGSGIASIEILGDPNTTQAPSPSANLGYGAYAILQCRDYAGAIAAPAVGSLITLELYMGNSSVLIAGE